MLRCPVRAQTFTLIPGEQRMLRVAAGSRCIVARGSVRLSEPPCWLGERLVGADLALPEGAEHVLRHDGWVALQAERASLLICEAPPSLAMRAWEAASRIIRPGRGLRAPA